MELEQVAEADSTARWNEVEKVVFERRSVRVYKSDQVPEALVRRILEAGRFAPSAGNSQPWKFVVLRDRAIIEEMERDAARVCRLLSFFLDWRNRGPLKRVAWLNAQAAIRVMPNELHPIPFGAITLIGQGRMKLFHDAPTVILILKDRRGVSNPDLDCGICGQNMVLTAHSLGLSTCWIGFVKVLMMSYTAFKWKRRFDISFPWSLVEGITLGYGVGNPNRMVERETREIKWFENGKQTVMY